MSPEPRAVKPKPQTETGGWSAGQVKQYADERIAELQRAVDVAREGSPPHVQLQYYIERILDEQRRGLTVAEQEREKAARALRIELDRAIKEGDRALRDHIEAQVGQIHSSLTSAEVLEKERMARVSDQVDAERRVSELTRQLSDIAISKAEVSAEKQFDEFSKSMKEQMGDLRSAIATLHATLSDLTRRLDKLA